jgi:cytochrome c biogenesis protein
MNLAIQSAGKKLWKTLSAIQTGVILLIVVGAVAAAGTVILQRPLTDPEEMQRAYSPQVLRLLDATGLTDVYHTWWFLALLALVSITIICASIERFPNAWRFYARPYKTPDEHFRKALPLQKQIPIGDLEAALEAAGRIFRKHHVRTERVGSSLFAERNRFSVTAVYIVHASLLMIFAGGILGGLFGYRGYISLTRGQQSSEVALRDGGTRALPFSIRCDAAGQENYPDGTPKRWWSKLAVLENGREVLRKEIAVNDPLTYGGVRFFQSGFGQTGELDKILLTVTPAAGTGAAREIALSPGETAQLDADTTLMVAEFIPDYVVRDGHVYTRSRDMVNPALHLVVNAKSKPIHVWIPPIPGFEQNSLAPYAFDVKDLEMQYFTGLQVAHEPGQWVLWGGVLLMGAGLFVAFYMVHQRFWVVPIETARGQRFLWMGASANKNREVFAERFAQLVKEVEAEVASSSGTQEKEVSLAGV